MARDAYPHDPTKDAALTTALPFASIIMMHNTAGQHRPWKQIGSSGAAAGHGATWALRYQTPFHQIALNQVRTVLTF